MTHPCLGLAPLNLRTIFCQHPRGFAIGLVHPFHTFHKSSMSVEVKPSHQTCVYVSSSTTICSSWLSWLSSHLQSPLSWVLFRFSVPLNLHLSCALPLTPPHACIMIHTLSQAHARMCVHECVFHGICVHVCTYVCVSDVQVCACLILPAPPLVLRRRAIARSDSYSGL